MTVTYASKGAATLDQAKFFVQDIFASRLVKGTSILLKNTINPIPAAKGIASRFSKMYRYQNYNADPELARLDKIAETKVTTTQDHTRSLSENGPIDTNSTL